MACMVVKVSAGIQALSRVKPVADIVEEQADIRYGQSHLSMLK